MSLYIFDYSYHLRLELTLLHFFYNYHKLDALVNVYFVERLTTIKSKVQIFQDPNRAASAKKIPFEKPALDLQKLQ